MNKQPDFIAELQYLTTEEGGRKTPAFSGYRPQVKFTFSDMQTSGEQVFIDTDTVYPGDTITATIRILGTEFFAGSLERPECLLILGKVRELLEPALFLKF